MVDGDGNIVDEENVNLYRSAPVIFNSTSECVNCTDQIKDNMIGDGVCNTCWCDPITGRPAYYAALVHFDTSRLITAADDQEGLSLETVTSVTNKVLRYGQSVNFKIINGTRVRTELGKMVAPITSRSFRYTPAALHHVSRLRVLLAAFHVDEDDKTPLMSLYTDQLCPFASAIINIVVNRTYVHRPASPTLISKLESFIAEIQDAVNILTASIGTPATNTETVFNEVGYCITRFLSIYDLIAPADVLQQVPAVIDCALILDSFFTPMYLDFITRRGFYSNLFSSLYVPFHTSALFDGSGRLNGWLQMDQVAKMKRIDELRIGSYTDTGLIDALVSESSELAVRVDAKQEEVVRCLEQLRAIEEQVKQLKTNLSTITLNLELAESATTSTTLSFMYSASSSPSPPSIAPSSSSCQSPSSSSSSSSLVTAKKKKKKQTKKQEEEEEEESKTTVTIIKKKQKQNKKPTTNGIAITQEAQSTGAHIAYHTAFDLLDGTRGPVRDLYVTWGDNTPTLAVVFAHLCSKENDYQVSFRAMYFVVFKISKSGILSLETKYAKEFDTVTLEDGALYHLWWIKNCQTSHAMHRCVRLVVESRDGDVMGVPDRRVVCAVDRSVPSNKVVRFSRRSFGVDKDTNITVHKVDKHSTKENEPPCIIVYQASIGGKKRRKEQSATTEEEEEEDDEPAPKKQKTNNHNDTTTTSTTTSNSSTTTTSIDQEPEPDSDATMTEYDLDSLSSFSSSSVTAVTAAASSSSNFPLQRNAAIISRLKTNEMIEASMRESHADSLAGLFIKGTETNSTFTTPFHLFTCRTPSRYVADYVSVRNNSHNSHMVGTHVASSSATLADLRAYALLLNPQYEHAVVLRTRMSSNGVLEYPLSCNSGIEGQILIEQDATYHVYYLSDLYAPLLMLTIPCPAINGTDTVLYDTTDTTETDDILVDVMRICSVEKDAYGGGLFGNWIASDGREIDDRHFDAINARSHPTLCSDILRVQFTPFPNQELLK